MKLNHNVKTLNTTKGGFQLNINFINIKNEEKKNEKNYIHY